ncbi:Partner of bursicon [Lepeophtheirus salmonis]|uniref:Partner of bursicon n=1 Tax=Lepeophtheirus salmonis TaxID=72036 RepID=A0A0K2TDF4_LEPSM|nr:Partner of bursicon [Lepeophtheirus salmonis]CAF2904880.1 Partner of bursicon [Lepeophtheirus salmonis]
MVNTPTLFKSSVLYISFLLLLVGESLCYRKLESACETLPSDIHIVKEEFDQISNLVRTCEANVAVNKCEGACVSSIKPSALSKSGFTKDCNCCKESGYRQRSIELNNCFDPNGVRLGGTQGQMSVSINEPMNCKCNACGV